MSFKTNRSCGLPDCAAVVCHPPQRQKVVILFYHSAAIYVGGAGMQLQSGHPEHCLRSHRTMARVQRPLRHKFVTRRH
jgi:hypothetical protein